MCLLPLISRSRHPDIRAATSLNWTIWTINEPANYIIAACLPTLRPIFLRILPSSFFILSNQRNRPFRVYTSSFLKVSWPRGSLAPKLRLETRFQTCSRITGPWDKSARSQELEADAEIGRWTDLERGVVSQCGQRNAIKGSFPRAAKEKEGMVEIKEINPIEEM